MIKIINESKRDEMRAARMKATEILAELGLKPKKIGDMGYGLDRITDEQASKLYKMFDWEEDNSDPEYPYYDCVIEYPEAGEYGGIMMGIGQLGNQMFVVAYDTL